MGGTNARWALVDDHGRLSRIHRQRCSEIGSVEAALRDYLAPLRSAERPREAAIAVAGPVVGDRVQLTNHDWDFSIRDLEQQLGLHRLRVLNDFRALSLALPALEDSDCELLQAGEGDAGSPLAVIGPGTGLGIGALIPHPTGWLPVSTEGGHQDLAAADEREWQIFRILRRQYGHVSAERVLSGPGVVDLYAAVCELEGEVADRSTAADVVAAARAGASEAAQEATARFSAWLGAVAGDLALVFGARGGVYLGGGMLPKMQATFDRARFSERFVAKGRFRSYLEAIPVRLIQVDVAALQGAARALEEGWST